MKKLIAALLMSTALSSTVIGTPAMAADRQATITVEMQNYSGRAAYLAIYVTKPDGSYDSTLWVAGTKQRYLGDLTGWVRALQTASSFSLDGITGASVGSGQTLTIHPYLTAAMIDAGYQVHVESAVEHGGEYPDDAVATITSQGQTVSGNGYVRSLTVSM